jgi:hypothetical protein
MEVEKKELTEFEKQFPVFCIPEKEVPFLIWSTIFSIGILIMFELSRNNNFTIFGVSFAIIIGFSKGLLCGFILTTLKKLIQADYSEKKHDGN